MNSTSKLRTALLALLTISFITVFSTGCGNSREDFVVTNNNNLATNGNLLFRFQQAAVPQTIDTVPAGTTTVRIDLFSSEVQNAGTFVVGETFPFAETVVFENVPPNVVSSLVTTFNSDGLPTGFLVGNVVVVPGQNNEVDLGDSQAVPFDSIAVTPDPAVLVVGPFGTNGTDSQQLTITGQFAAGFQNQVNAQTTGFGLPINANSTEFTLGNSSLANISADGVLSVQFEVGQPNNPTGNTTLTTTYDFLGVERTDTTDVLVFFFGANAAGTPEVSENNDYSAGYATQFIGSDSQQRPTSGGVTYSLESAVQGVDVDPQTGVVSADSTATVGTDFNVVVTFVDDGTGGSGRTFTDTVEFTVVSGTSS